jgi:hypothetical protein
MIPPTGVPSDEELREWCYIERGNNSHELFTYIKQVRDRTLAGAWNVQARGAIGDIAFANRSRISTLESELKSAQVKLSLWRAIAYAMVKRAKRIKCQFGGDHSVADCNCDPHQLGDAVFSMQEELDKTI